MPEIGSGLCPGFPASLDTDAVPETANDFVRLDWGNDVAACIAAIEAELGTAPSGDYATVAARLNALSAAAGGGVPRGANSARPAPTAGVLYYSEDLGVLEFSDGLTWRAVMTG